MARAVFFSFRYRQDITAANIVRRAWQTSAQRASSSGEEAVIGVFESEPALAGMCPPDGVTMLHRAAQYALLRVARWLLDTGPT